MRQSRSETEILSDFMSNMNGDIFQLATDLGLEVKKDTRLGRKSGQIEFDGKYFSISVNALENPKRQKFTAAHEIAHYILHRDLLKAEGKLNRHTDQLFDGAEKNEVAPLSPRHEVEANQYAARLLMPAVLVRKHYDKAADNFGDMANMFGVSQQAMKIRLANLGLRSL
ncbi:MAG: ImmA/IrrE family metallo-endopeptidase [Shimia thalassica]|uniref:ImmA/IrrE family metallo-endopeptidase n=1 Tax=Shimia thalassica TaxID=1715693 RepID=UPI003299F837